ncbi:tRNA (adenine(22)-N(1))-methyltransferase [Anaerocolumna aminovalerica]|uniref:tRNA (adenine(22)-N(1))-methyltransferase n=1 Tax=Anaerocolumna aminovalerica TaxID=1527 RepID=UPI00248C4C71|nr:class I SAM-dependent methyltransferase [Anaerocolumna aminovalerica]
MQLSKRLQAVADSVTKGNRVADVGCDHAYISIYLISQNIAPSVIAMDVNKGPLERGQENIKRLGLGGQIETRLSDGLYKLNPGEADTILIAGMGGALTVRILEEGLASVKKCRELVLQPQSELAFVRKFLEQIEFEIVAEQMLIDDGKYYTIIKAISMSNDTVENEKEPVQLKVSKRVNEAGECEKAKLPEDTGTTHDNNRELFHRYGKLLLQKRDPITKEFLLREKKQCLQVIKALKQNPTENAMARLKEVEEELGYIEAGLVYYKG